VKFFKGEKTMKKILIGVSLAFLLFACASNAPVIESKIDDRPSTTTVAATTIKTTTKDSHVQQGARSTRFDLPRVAAMTARDCQPPRFTGNAPKEYYSRKNPLAVSNVDSQAAERLYTGELAGVNCAVCHGRKGDGKGVIAKDFSPPPRNFKCSGTINGIPDGQLFWIIRFGSPNTEMPDHPKLRDEQVWQLVLYLRQLAQ
jgi:mono/diheme cytochrome c family protein